MILKEKQKKKIKKNIKKSNFFKYYFYTTVSFLIISLFIFFTSDMWGYYKLKLIPRLDAYGILNYTKLPEIFLLKIKGHVSKKKKIYLDINFENLSNIENERNSIIKETKNKNNVQNITFQFTEYNAKITIDNKKFPIKIRLKGDRQTHWKDKSKSSYRIKLKGKNRLNGLKEFSIQKPRARNYIYEWLFHELNSENADAITLKYEFFNLYINGENQGLYVLEESFSHILLERNKKRNGPIFSMKEDYLSLFNDKKFTVYDKSTWTNRENIDLTNIAYTKLNKFLKGKSTVSETFNIKNLAWFLAANDLLGTYHGMNLKSSKFYYNPITGLFEIIPYDGHYINPILTHSAKKDRERLIPEWFGVLNDENTPGAVDFVIYLAKGIHKDKKFSREYYTALQKISSKNFLKKFFDSRKKNISRINSLIYSDYFFNDFIAYYGPGIYYFHIESVYKRAEMIREKLETNEFKLFSFTKNGYLNIENSNFYNPYLVLTKINCLKKNITFKKLIILKDFNNKIENNEIIKSECQSIDLINKLTQKKIKIKIDYINREVDLYSKNLNFLKYFDIKENQLLLKTNTINISEDIFIPKNFSVKIYGGQKIILLNDAFIISESPWIAKSKKNNQIIISGYKNNFGGGLLIYSTNEKSTFENVNFSYLNGMKNNQKSFNNGLIIMGALNFYKTKTDLINVNFKKINSEDAINIFRSSFKIENIKFIGNSSDAIDFDFSNGDISNAFFENIGNDAIDFSGSKSNVKNIYFKNVNDKLISVGENSIINISDINGNDSFVGITSKDGSVVKANNIFMKNVKLPFASYNKKLEYEKSEMFLENIELIDFHQKWLTYNNSKIFYNKKSVGQITKKIIPIIYNGNLNLINKLN